MRYACREASPRWAGRGQGRHQSRFVPFGVVPMKVIFPGDNPVVLLPQRTPPLNPILDTPGNIFQNPVNIFDDKMAVVNASLRGLERGAVLASVAGPRAQACVSS